MAKRRSVDRKRPKAAPPARRRAPARGIEVARVDDKLLRHLRTLAASGIREPLARRMAALQATRGNQYVQRLLTSAPARDREELGASKAGAPVRPTPLTVSRESVPKAIAEGEDKTFGPGPEANAVGLIQVANIAATGKDVEHPDLTTTVLGATVGLGGSLAALFKGTWNGIKAIFKSRGSRPKGLHKKLKKRDLSAAVGDIARGILSGGANAITLADKIMNAGGGVVKNVAMNTVGASLGILLSVITTVRNARKGYKAGKRRRKLTQLIKGWKATGPGDPMKEPLDRASHLARLALIAKWTKRKMRRKEGRMSLEAVTAAIGGIGGIFAILTTVATVGAAIPIIGWAIAGVALALGLGLAGWKLGSWAKKRAQGVKIWMRENKKGKREGFKMFFSIKRRKELKATVEKFNADSVAAAELSGRVAKEKSFKRDAYAREILNFLKEQDPPVKQAAEDLVKALGLKPDDIRKGGSDGLKLLKEKMAST